MVEMAITLAIVAIVATVAYDAMRRARPRATFEGVTAELQSLVHGARQQALAEGVPVAVLVFPDYVTPGGGQGRIVVYQDGAFSLFSTAAALNFDNYNPGVLAATAPGKVVTTLDLPSGVKVGPATGLGAASVPFPYSGVATNVSCSFCNGSGNHRGAIVFDARGRASFYSATGTALGASGGSFSIYGTDLAVNATTFTTSTLVVMSPFGAMRIFHNG
jgi:hypothetical protein